MKAQSINLSVICSIPLAPLAGASNRRGGASRAAHYPQKQNPADCGVLPFSAPDGGGSGGSGPFQARLLVVSRASFGEVQRSLAGLKVIHRQRVQSCSARPADVPGRAHRERPHPTLLAPGRDTPHRCKARHYRNDSFYLFMSTTFTGGQDIHNRATSRRSERYYVRSRRK